MSPLPSPVAPFASSHQAGSNSPLSPVSGSPDRTLLFNTAVDFNDVDPLELARQLTLLDQDKFSLIRALDLIRRLLEGHSERTHRVAEFIDWFNRVSGLVSSEICKQPETKKRAKLIELFATTAIECRRLRNINSAMAILSGLNNSAVRRLKQTWSMVPVRVLEELHEVNMRINANAETVGT